MFALLQSSIVPCPVTGVEFWSVRLLVRLVSSGPKLPGRVPEDQNYPDQKTVHRTKTQQMDFLGQRATKRKRVKRSEKTIEVARPVLLPVMVQSFDPLLARLTTGNQQRLALTCRSLYREILTLLRARILELVRQPFDHQPIYLRRCPHKCDPYGDETPFVAIWVHRERARLRCTHCLHSHDSTHLPPTTWWPSHGENVSEIVQKLGARHSLLACATD